jgi:hypothetical protein
MTIQRLYQSNPQALERVVEILYRVLVESPGKPADGSGSASGEVHRVTCLSTEPEG